MKSLLSLAIQIRVDKGSPETILQLNSSLV